MEPSNDSFLALLEERISKRDGNSGKKLIPTGHTVFYTLRVDVLRTIRYKKTAVLKRCGSFLHEMDEISSGEG